ncbi:ABC transporter permease [Rhizobium leguminosarum]|nr:ABC transporter permease [Rhizobium leguminosarum]
MEIGLAVVMQGDSLTIKTVLTRFFAMVTMDRRNRRSAAEAETHMVASPMLRFTIRRVFLGALTLLAVCVIVFAATQILPGDAARAVLGRNATPERLMEIRAQLQLDRPMIIQFWSWFSGILTGDPGQSLVNGMRVIDIVYPRAVNSAVLLVLTSLASVPLSIALGVIAALYAGRVVDASLSVIALALAALPEFVVGILLILLLSTSLFHIFPAVSLVPPGSSVLQNPIILVMPVLTLSVVCFPYLFRMTRSAVLEVLASEYIEMARLKGISTLRLVFVHALPNALAPVVQVIALTLAYLAGGVVLVEFVFGYPGIGQGLLDAVVARDIPVIQLTVLLLATVYVLLNLVADLIAMLLTPKMSARQWQTT